MIGQKGIATSAGGVEKHVEEISMRLVKEGHQVTVYYRDTFMKKNMKEYKGIRLIKIKTFKFKSLDAIVYTLKATANALYNNYEVYHYHALGPASLSFIPKLFQKKVIVTVHGLDWKRDKWGKFGKAYLKFGEFIVGNFSDRVICVSDNIRKYLVCKYKKRDDLNTIFIPNGVNIEEGIGASLIKRYKLKENDYILFLARLVPEKGAHYLIQSYNQLNIDVKLVIAGGDSFTKKYMKYLRSLSRGNDNIIFTGNVSGQLLNELYTNCLFYVLPSDIEGMPLSLLEALSYGKYCVTSDIDENKSVINYDILGTTFIKGNVDSLKNKILLTLSSDSYKKNSEERKKYIKERYNWNESTYSTEAVYNSLFSKTEKIKCNEVT
ncbi:glycosyltransferase family 4 protein [Clostridium sp. BL-8]|uniref:glycosyltransferase family 4 protein n=1 Tax=Clostridium sp. BL-8 TaxID=349938 RepID=UPI0009CB5A0E|nr:glycosyltransferase family 4 protein [Clostridium sp. BL-8]OOM79447.1 GDP-mannose-dependent alpha-(1-6)-phosphatidylinositol monomannoside mannosyltransferase [Clostridium sp. BL-8]